ncbi:MAG TPA: hypothetical protein PK014_07110 [Thermoanaerobaculia bacterium]|nr:hypothetical protein [Thermoanaerobaculia bacterium]HUM29790.1 hypothetical protein [Thermoanaerobaculia bacterium]HXK68065.1 hypothetical protein [Thermoanaerobaculia bacterium]
MPISKIWVIPASVAAFPAALAFTRLTNAPLLFPFAAALLFYPAFIRTLLRGHFGSAFRLSVLWALSGTLTVLIFTTLAPREADASILNGRAYRVEMMEWMETGTGRESTPSAFLPQHALHLGLFSAATVGSAGLLGLVAGAYLLNYMNVYVATYAASSGTGWIGWILAWHPWALIRVASYLALGVYLSAVFLRLTKKIDSLPPSRWLWLGMGGTVLDVLMKIILAPGWHRLLASFHGLSLP